MSSEGQARLLYRKPGGVLLLFGLIAAVHVLAACQKSLPLNLVGMLLYGLTPLILVRRGNWMNMRLRKPIRIVFLLPAGMAAALFVGASYVLLSSWVGLNSTNFFVLLARSQTVYGVINPSNAWRYFPAAALGYSILSPVTEEVFFRGILLTALETRFSKLQANLLQALLFGAIHLAYFGLTQFSMALVYTMLPLITAAGVLYGWTAQKIESVWGAAIAHAFLNFLLVLVVYAFVIPAIG